MESLGDNMAIAQSDDDTNQLSLELNLVVQSDSTLSGERPDSDRKHENRDNQGNEHGLPVAERSRLLRAKRNREAAHRSRTKNKLRQSLLEEETKRHLELNVELRDLLEFLLPNLNTQHTLSGERLPSGSQSPIATLQRHQ